MTAMSSRSSFSLFLLLALLCQACGTQEKTVMESSSQPKSTESRPFDLQGHRGCRGLRPENTIDAFLHAMSLGVNTLELDVCLSADGQVVVTHEPWMSNEICSRENGDSGKRFHFGELTYEQIREWDCGSTQHHRYPEQVNAPAVKPLLTEVIAAAEAEAARTGQQIAYNIEIKARKSWDGKEQPAPEISVPTVLNVIREAGVLERSTLQSFDYRVLRLVREQEPELTIAQLVDLQVLFETELQKLGFHPDIYSPNYRQVTATLVRKAHAANIKVIPWTVNDEVAMRRMVHAGVDGLITDYPDRAIALLEEMGVR